MIPETSATVSSSDTLEDMVLKTTSSKLGHAERTTFSFGFHPNVVLVAALASTFDVASMRLTSQNAGRAINPPPSKTLDCASRKENRKFEYPPAKNSPTLSAMDLNDTRGPTSFISKETSEQSIERRAPLGETTCIPQHVNSNCEKSSRRENSYCTDTPARFTSRSAWFTTSTLAYASRAPSPPTTDASLSIVAPTRSNSSLGLEIHASALTRIAPASNATQFVSAYEEVPSGVCAIAPIVAHIAYRTRRKIIISFSRRAVVVVASSRRRARFDRHPRRPIVTRRTRKSKQKQKSRKRSRTVTATTPTTRRIVRRRSRFIIVIPRAFPRPFPSRVVIKVARAKYKQSRTVRHFFFFHRTSLKGIFKLW